MAEPFADGNDPPDAAADPTSGVPDRPGLSTIKTGLGAFLLATLVGNLFVIWWKRPEGLGELFGQANLWLLALTLPMVALDHVLGGLRYRVLFNGRILPKISLWDCMRSNYANLFMGMVTPAQTGGGPAQIYLLCRSGATVADGMLTSLVNFAATLVFFLVGAVTALFLLPDHLFDPRLTTLFRGGFVLLVGLVLLVFGLILFPHFFLGVISKIFGMVPGRWGRLKRACDRLVGRLGREVAGFRAALEKLWRQQPGLLPVVFLLTVTLFMNKYLIGYVIASAFESNVPLGIFICLQVCQLFLIYFAPTPGASGLAELTSVWMLATILSAGTLVVYTMIWRVATTVIGAVIGGGVLFRDLRR